MVRFVHQKPKMRWGTPVVVAVLGAVLLAAAYVAVPRGRQGQQGLPTTTMKIGSKTFTLEIARTKDQLETGLMDRDSMPADHGMIFVFDKPDERHFWMKDTRIPLDIIFLGQDGKVVSVRQMKAFDEKTDTASEGPAQYAIELNLDAATAAGVLPGDRLDLPAAAITQPATAPSTVP